MLLTGLAQTVLLQARKHAPCRVSFFLTEVLYNYRHRYYRPETGRFINRDPLGYVDGMGLYAYVGNDPVNRVDAMGLYVLRFQGSIAAAGRADDRNVIRAQVEDIHFKLKVMLPIVKSVLEEKRTALCEFRAFLQGEARNDNPDDSNESHVRVRSLMYSVSELNSLYASLSALDKKMDSVTELLIKEGVTKKDNMAEHHNQAGPNAVVLPKCRKWYEKHDILKRSDLFHELLHDVGMLDSGHYGTSTHRVENLMDKSDDGIRVWCENQSKVAEIEFQSQHRRAPFNPRTNEGCGCAAALGAIYYDADD